MQIKRASYFPFIAEAEDLMRVNISGKISADLKWITFTGNNLVGININFLVNYIWNNFSTGIPIF